MHNKKAQYNSHLSTHDIYPIVQRTNFSSSPCLVSSPLSSPSSKMQLFHLPMNLQPAWPHQREQLSYYCCLSYCAVVSIPCQLLFLSYYPPHDEIHQQRDEIVMVLLSCRQFSHSPSYTCAQWGAFLLLATYTAEHLQNIQLGLGCSSAASEGREEFVSKIKKYISYAQSRVI